MTTASAASEEALQDCLRADPDRAIALLHEWYALQIARYLKRVTWSLLGPEDLKDAYQETLRAVLERVRAPGFDPRRPLRLVYAIARRKGTDFLRRRGHRPNTNEDAILHLVAADLKETDLGFAWKKRMGPVEAKEFREVLLKAVAVLPERQRLVARVFIDHFEEFRERDTYQPLARAVSAVTGEPENVAAVKSAWRAARATLAEELARRGYPIAEGINP
jgi:DNA-directed RNA polymerase specialized sigma24 family protein